VMQAKGGARFAGLPLVLLTDGDSYSSSEIVTAAIMDHQRGLVIGTKTGGKGIIQDTIALDAKSSLHLTIARWLSPAGQWIHHKGIQPTIEIANDPTTAADEPLELARQRLQ
jgi:carboxyl-terminal processing protease